MTFKDIFTSFYSWKMFNTGLLLSVLVTILVILIWTFTGYIPVDSLPTLEVAVSFYAILGTTIFVVIESMWQALKLLCALFASSCITLGLRSKSETLVAKSNKLLTMVREVYEKD